MSQRPGSGARGFVFGVALLAVVAVAATGLVWTNTLGAGEKWSSLVQHVRLVVAPPPDRAITDVVTISEDILPSPSPAPAPVRTPPPTRQPGVTPDPHATPEPTLSPTPKPTPAPKRKPVDFQLRVATQNKFTSQVDNTMCAPAGLQMVLNMYGVGQQGPAFQKEVDGRLPEFESRRDAKAGGWGPAAMVSALDAYGVKGYELRAYQNRAFALRDAARIMTVTNAPVILIAWRGAHTWVMTGYQADADPTIFRDANITGTYIFDPWYPRISTIWGASDPPGTFQDESEMIRNFLEWHRPEGAYPERDGLFIIVAPTLTMKEQRQTLGT